MGTETGCHQGTGQVVVGVVLLAAFVKEGCITLVIVAVALVEILGGGGHVDECYILLVGQLLHLEAVVHGVVVGGHLQARFDRTIDDGIVFVAQVMTTRACDGVSVEVATTNGRHQNGCRALLFHSINDLLQALFVRR